MKQLPCKPLPRWDQQLLQGAARIVPREEREQWMRTWHAELWHLRHSGRYADRASLLGPSVGVTRDALWLRTEYLKRCLAGTPLLCMGCLVCLIGLSGVVGIGVAGTTRDFVDCLESHLALSLSAGVLVAFVSACTNFRRRHESKSRIALKATVQRVLFFAGKAGLIGILAFVLSTALSIPFHREFPVPTDLLQAFDFVVLALSGVRWALMDQEGRCKQCLHALTAAARIGRPSRNLLEWNGSELSCRHGHGLLSVPEMETSWRDASRWVVCGEGQA